MKKKMAKKEKNDADHVGDSFIPSMKSQDEIFWMVHWWVLGHSSATLLNCPVKPLGIL